MGGKDGRGLALREIVHEQCFDAQAETIFGSAASADDRLSSIVWALARADRADFPKTRNGRGHWLKLDKTNAGPAVIVVFTYAEDGSVILKGIQAVPMAKPQVQAPPISIVPKK